MLLGNRMDSYCCRTSVTLLGQIQVIQVDNASHYKRIPVFDLRKKSCMHIAVGY